MKTITFILLLFTSTSVSAQHINSCYVIPANPVNGQKISLVIDVTLPSSDCWLVDTTNHSHCNSYIIEACYGSGLLTTICNRVDTLSLGILGYDSFSLDFKMWYSQSGDSTICQNATITDSALIKFGPDDTTSISSFQENSSYFQVFPNPILDHLNIRSLQKSSISCLILTFYDVYLKETKKVVLNAFKEEASVSLDNIGLGVYYLKIENGDQIFVKKICVMGK